MSNKVLQPEEEFKDSQSIQMVQRHNALMPLAITLVTLFAVIIICLVAVPWQQTVPGKGKVTIFSPMERPQTIESQIDGRIKQWHILEGDIVKQGDLLLELTELNPVYLDAEQLVRLRGQKDALISKKQAVEASINALSSQSNYLSQLPSVAVPAASIKIQQAQNKLTAEKQKLVTAELNLKRRQELFNKGLRSKRDLELAELDYANAKAAVEIAEREANIATLGQDQTNMETMAKAQDAMAKVASSQERLAAINSELLNMDNQISNLENRVAQRKIVSPIDGQVVRVQALGSGETVKSGNPVATIAPLSSDQAVELYVSDFNVPLLAIGRPVRLQFSGWPAIQFSGWPSIAVGTFGGKVAVIDAVDNGLNQFRVLVRPDKEAIARGDDQPWPKMPYLRPGTQANGWIMLDTVPLGFELWRQFNGFPPAIDKPNAKDVMNLKRKK